MINSRIAAYNSPIDGQGLVATDVIKVGAVVWRRDPRDPLLRLPDVEKLTKQQQEEFYQFAFQCSSDTFVLCQGIDKYMNHSCDPNTWWGDDDTLIARWAISPGQEVTYDYASADILLEYAMPCTCGAALCRTVVTNGDYLNKEWQARYGSHLPRHVLAAIAEARTEKDGRR